MVDLSNIDYDALIADLAPILTQGIEHLLEGAKNDIEKFATRITRLMVYAQLRGDEDMGEQLLDQLKLLAEIQSIRVRNASWTVVAAVVTMVFKAVAATIKTLV